MDIKKFQEQQVNAVFFFPDLKLSLFLFKTSCFYLPLPPPIKGKYRISNTELRMSKFSRLGFVYFDIRSSIFCGSLFAFFVFVVERWMLSVER